MRKVLSFRKAKKCVAFCFQRLRRGVLLKKVYSIIARTPLSSVLGSNKNSLYVFTVPCQTRKVFYARGSWLLKNILWACSRKSRLAKNSLYAENFMVIITKEVYHNQNYLEEEVFQEPFHKQGSKHMILKIYRWSRFWGRKRSKCVCIFV